MTTETKTNEQDSRKQKVAYRGGASDAVYAFGLVRRMVLLHQHSNHILGGLAGTPQGVLLARVPGL